MIIGRTIQAIDSHTAGMPTRIIVGGVPHLEGRTMTEKATFFTDQFGPIRTALFQEPRGLLRGVGALITPPANGEAQLGVIFMDAKYPLISMCGHGSIGVVTAAVEFGMVEVIEPITTVVLDTPAGLVTGYAKVKNAVVESVSIQNVPSFLYESTAIDVPHLGRIEVDIAFGGEFFALIESDAIGISVDRKNLSRLSELAITIRDLANSQITVTHPEKQITTIDAVRIFARSADSHNYIRNVTVFEEGDKGVDRSPCGTGTSAHLATSHAKGEIEPHRDYIHESIIGTTFAARVASVTKVGPFDAIIPEITGSAYTMGMNTLVIPPNDPLKDGFLMEG